MTSDGGLRSSSTRGLPFMVLLLLVTPWEYVSASSEASEAQAPVVPPHPSSPLFVDQLSSVISTVLPVVTQILSPLENAGGAANTSGGGGGGLGMIYDVGQKAAGALATSLATDEARESLWVPLHEQLGQVRDFLGLPADDAQGVRSAARLLFASQLPLLRFAMEREVCTDPEADKKALRLVTEYPAAKKVLNEYMDQTPDRNIRAAPGELAALYNEMKEHFAVLRGAGEGQVLPVSILGGLDMLSSTAASKVGGYLGTLARYLMYSERFTKNKKGLVFFAKNVLPRLLQLFALQLDGCRYLWRFLADISARPDGISFNETAEGGINSAPAIPLYEGEALGALGAIAQNLGFKTPSIPYAHGRAFARRMLARVQVQLVALYSLSRGCLAATSLEFQRQYAEAQDKVELGEAPSAAFAALLEESELLGQSGSKKNTGDPQETETRDKARRSTNPRLRALTRGSKPSRKQTEETPATTPPTLSLPLRNVSGESSADEDKGISSPDTEDSGSTPASPLPRKTETEN